MAKETSWIKLVKEVYHNNKHKPNYKFKNALKDAAKIHKKHTRKATPYPVKVGGECPLAAAQTVVKGGSKRSTRKKWC